MITSMGKHDEHTLGTGLGCLPIFRRYGQCETFEQCNRQPGPTPFSLDHESPRRTAQRFFLPQSEAPMTARLLMPPLLSSSPSPKPHLRFGCHTIARDHLSSLRQIEDPPPLPSFPSLSVTSFLGQSIRSKETDHFAIS